MIDTYLSEKEPSSFFENAPTAIAMFDKEMNCLAASKSWLSFLHQDTSSKPKRSCFESVSWIPSHWLEEHQRALGGEEIKSHQETVDIAGKAVRIRRHLQPWCDESGEIGGIIICLEDVTEASAIIQGQQENANRYEKMIQMANSAIIHWACDGTILFANAYALSLFGYTSEQMVGSNINLIVPQEESGGGDLTTLVANIIADPDSFENNINENIRKDGSRVWMTWTNKPLRDEKGDTTSIIAVGINITEKREIEQRLRESEERFRSIVEGAPDPIFIQTGGLFAYLNPAACRLFGVARADDLIGSPVLERMHPDYHDYVRERIHRLNEDRQSVTEILEFRIVRIDGDEVWVETKGEPIIYKGKKGALVFVRDVHQRRATQEALRQSEERFKALAESAPVGIVISDPGGEVLFLNRHFTALLGYTIDDIPSVEHWWPLAYPDEQLRNEARLSWQQSTEQTTRSHFGSEPSEFPVRCRDGSIRHIEFRKHATGSLNFVILSDVSRRREAEMAALENAEDLRITLQSIGDAVITTDTRGCITRMNDVAEMLTGWAYQDAADQPLGKIFVIRNAKTGEPAENPIDRVLQTGRIVGLANHTVLLAKDGRSYQISDSAAPIKDTLGQIRGVVLVFRDVTESYNLRETIQRERNILQLFVKYAPAAIAMFDTEMRYLSASERFFVDYGLKDRNVIGRSHYEILPDIPNHWKEIHRRCLAGAVERRDDDPFPRADGKMDWVRWEIRPWYEDAGNIGGILLFSEVITNFKLAQNALLENELNIRYALEASGMGGWDLNLHDGTIHRSELHDRIFGYASFLQEWNFEKFIGHVHPEDRKKIHESLNKAVEDKAEWNSECRIHWQDDSLHWVRITGKLHKEDQNGMRHIAGYIQDITDRKRDEERIDHINRVLNAIRLINKLIVYEKDRQTLVQKVCDLLIETRGYRTAWAAVYDESGTFSQFAESGLGDAFKQLRIELENGKIPYCYNCVKDGRNEIFPIFETREVCSLCPLANKHESGAALAGKLRHNEQEYGVLVVALPSEMAKDKDEQSLFEELIGDIGYGLYNLQQEEKRKKAEEHYSLLFRASNDGILIADIETKTFRFANPSICSFLGYPEEELLTLDIHSIHPTENIADILTDFASQVSGENPFTYDVPCRRRDGSIVYADVNAVPIDFAGRKCLAGFFRDITARKLADMENDRLEKQLLQAQKMESIGRLAGGVAHDYNNMLSVIMGFAEIALEELGRNELPIDELAEILKAAERSSEITRQLLAFARKQTIAPIVLDLNDAVAGMLKMLQRLIGEDINLSWNPKTGLWPVKMDPAQIDQILANLCVNARDAIQDIGRITIETDNVRISEEYCISHPAWSAGDFVMLTVSDTGCGMDRETLERIFEPFFTTKELGKGTGLGMSTVYGIVKQNGGQINIHSEPGAGTAISIYIPCHHSDLQMKTAAKAEELPKGRGEMLLLVEDDPSVRNMGQTMLERLGYTVISAGSPDEAIDIASKYVEKIGLLITDVVMPGMNGKELADRLQQLYPDLKVLFMSGYTANAIAHHGVLDGNVNFIQKPFSRRDLAGKVNNILNRYGKGLQHPPGVTR